MPNPRLIVLMPNPRLADFLFEIKLFFNLDDLKLRHFPTNEFSSLRSLIKVRQSVRTAFEETIRTYSEVKSLLPFFLPTHHHLETQTQPSKPLNFFL